MNAPFLRDTIFLLSSVSSCLSSLVVRVRFPYATVGVPCYLVVKVRFPYATVLAYRVIGLFLRMVKIYLFL